jgi:predicted chitinase/peptidoglycan hydrolase-like protein with peptidoglycan-binding domain
MPRAIDIVRKVAPRARENYLFAFERGDALLKQHDITTPLRLAHFLAQVLHETDDLNVQWESGAYSAPRLMQIFGAGHHSAAITQSEASALCQQPMPRREELIFERVYGLGNPKKAKELGNVNPGDGYRYRGGGILQTTGRDNYRRMGQKCGVDFEAQPELVVSAEDALKPALAEWSEGNLNAAADRDDIVSITRRINGGQIGLDSRRDKLAKLKPLITSVEFADGFDARGPAPSFRDRVPQARPSALGPTPLPDTSDLAHRIIAAMERKGYQVDRGPGEVNIVYVEGMNPDGTANEDEANKWNDLRLLITFEGGAPRIIGKWAATTEPGRYYTQHPLSPLGAARIEFGQYKAWQVGMHHPEKPSRHEALRQDAGQITVCRDLNKDGQREGDRHETGSFCINQHWGNDLPEVEQSSAGCLVGQSKTGHREFMALVKSDPRYVANSKHVFATTVLPAPDVLAESQAAVEPEAGLLPYFSDVSEEVRRWQKLLGFSEKDQDGIFGAITEEAVKMFQRRHGLTVTGDMDERTRNHLEREMGGSSERPFTGEKPVERVPLPGVESRPEVSTTEKWVDLLMQRIQRLENILAADKARRDDVPFRPPGEVTIFPPPGGVTPSRPPGEVTVPTNPNDIGAWLERLVPLVQRLQPQATTTSPSALPQTEQLRKALDLLTAIIAPGSDHKVVPLGQVNGALGETLGKLLNGKKTAIGVGGAALTSILAHVPAETGLGQVLALLTPAVGLSPFAMPVLLGLSAWGMLGKFEKWRQGTAPPPRIPQ